MNLKTFTPSGTLLFGSRMCNSLYDRTLIFQQYANQYLFYDGDTTSQDYTNLQTVVQTLYSSYELQDVVNSAVFDTSMHAGGVKQLMITMDLNWGDKTWPNVSAEKESVEVIPPRTTVDTVQLISSLNLKIEYFKKYLDQLIETDSVANPTDFNTLTQLCKDLFTYPAKSFDTTNITEKSGIKQILYGLDLIFGAARTGAQNQVWPIVQY